MNYNALEERYWTDQVTRVERLRQRIVARAEVRSGVTIPDDDDLVIGNGRVLSATILFIDISGFSRRPLRDTARSGADAEGAESVLYADDSDSGRL